VPNTKTEAKPVNAQNSSQMNLNVVPFVPFSKPAEKEVTKEPVKEVVKEVKEVKPKDAITLKLEKLEYDDESI